MELRHLRYFVAVAETGSLSRAAEKLFIAQPPLSLQIRHFEEELGVALFIRHPKGVRLTPAGQALLPEARQVLDRAARMADIARNPREGEGLTLSLGYVPSASSTVLPSLVRHLRARHPGIELGLHEMISDAQISALVSGQIDAGIARIPARHARVSLAHQMPDPFCLALPGTDAPPAGVPLDLRDYREHVFVGFTRHRGPAYFDQSIHLCSQAGFSPRIRYEATTVHGVLDLVSAGLGVALVPASAALLGGAMVTVRRLRQPAHDQVLCLLRRKTDANPALTALQSAAESIFDELQRGTAALLDRPAAAPADTPGARKPVGRVSR